MGHINRHSDVQDAPCGGTSTTIPTIAANDVGHIDHHSSLRGTRYGATDRGHPLSLGLDMFIRKY